VEKNGRILAGGTTLHSFDLQGTAFFRDGIDCGQSPAIAADNSIICAVNSPEGLGAFNPNGSQNWIYSGIKPTSIPVIGRNGDIYVGTSSGIVALTPGGSLQWQVPLTSVKAVSLNIDEGLLAIRSREVTAVSSNGVIQWQFVASGTVTPVVADAWGSLYFGSTDRKLYALNPSGILKWVFVCSAAIVHPPALDHDGDLFVGSQDGLLYKIDRSGKKLWELDSQISKPVYPTVQSDNSVNIIVGNYLMALAGETEETIGNPWPVFGHDPQNSFRLTGLTTSLPQAPAGVSLSTVESVHVDVLVHEMRTSSASGRAGPKFRVRVWVRVRARCGPGALPERPVVTARRGVSFWDPGAEPGAPHTSMAPDERPSFPHQRPPRSRECRRIGEACRAPRPPPANGGTRNVLAEHRNDGASVGASRNAS